MRFQLPLLCLCAATVLAVERKDAVEQKDAAAVLAGKDLADKKDSMVLKTAEASAVLKEETAAKEVDAAAKKDINNDDVKLVKLPNSDKTWGEDIRNLAPTAEVFSANLGLYSKVNVKANIAAAFNLKDELDYWKKEGSPDRLEFLGDDGEKTYGVVSSNQPVLETNYVDGVKFHFFKKCNESDIKGVRVTDFSKLVDLGWDAKLPVKIITHGFTNTIKSPAIQLLKNAFLKTGKYNVIGVDWGKLCQGPYYPGARGHVSGAGAKVGEFVDALVNLKLTDPSLVHIMGHSLGAHVAGIAGKSVNTGKLARITGLDPAGPLFQLTKRDGHLWRDDAYLVDVIHTNAGFLGKSKNLGHVDFFPNGGHFQPGCPFDVTGSCSHSRSFEYFAYTVRENRGLRGAVLCPSLPDGAEECAKKRSVVDSDAEMGYPLKYKLEGAYFIKTLDKEPYEETPKIIHFDS